MKNNDTLYFCFNIFEQYYIIRPVVENPFYEDQFVFFPNKYSHYINLLNINIDNLICIRQFYPYPKTISYKKMIKIYELFNQYNIKNYNYYIF